VQLRPAGRPAGRPEGQPSGTSRPYRSPCTGSSGARAGSSPCRSPCTRSSGARGRSSPCHSPCTRPSGARAGSSPCRSSCTCASGARGRTSPSQPPCTHYCKAVVLLGAASTAACVCVLAVATFVLARQVFSLLRLLRGRGWLLKHLNERQLLYELQVAISLPAPVRRVSFKTMIRATWAPAKSYSRSPWPREQLMISAWSPVGGRWGCSSRGGECWRCRDDRQLMVCFIGFRTAAEKVVPRLAI
jgi:hypothetical protein